MCGENAFIAGADIGVCDQGENFIGPGAANNAPGIEPVAGGQGLTKRGCSAIGIEFEMVG